MPTPHFLPIFWKEIVGRDTGLITDALFYCILSSCHKSLFFQLKIPNTISRLVKKNGQKRNIKQEKAKQYFLIIMLHKYDIDANDCVGISAMLDHSDMSIYYRQNAHHC